MKNKVFEYTVPKDCTVKIEQSENSFVVLIEPKQVEFKDGDILADDDGFIAIYKSKKSSIEINYYGLLTKAKCLLFDNYCAVCDFKIATPEQQQILFDALAKEGKQWNFGSKCIEPLKHIPKEGDFVRFSYKNGIGYFICGKFHDGAVYQQKETAMIDVEGDIFNRDSNRIAYPFNEACIFETISKEEFAKSINDLGYEYNFETNEIAPLKWQPKQGDEVHHVIFGREEDKFIIHSFTWHKEFQLNGVHKLSIKEAQQLCDKLNSVLNEK